MIIKVAELKELKAKEEAHMSQLLIDLPSIPEGSSKLSPPVVEHEEKKKSILGSIGRRTSKRSSSSVPIGGGKAEEVELVPSNCGLLFGVPLASIANKGKPLFESFGVPAFFGGILEIIKRKRTRFRLCVSLQHSSF